jgi:hypothetical protein
MTSFDPGVDASVLAPAAPPRRPGAFSNALVFGWRAVL